MVEIKAIETAYKGYRFRSRLEARWAVFFDALGIKWEYEREGFDLGNVGWYLPDFWLPHPNEKWQEAGHWFEIKGIEPSAKELQKVRDLAKGTKNTSFLAVGPPGEHVMFWAHNSGTFGWQPEYKGPDSFRDSPVFNLTCVMSRWIFNPEEAVAAAISCAKSARFEHGETPII